MPYLSKYNLESSCHKNDALFIFLESLSLVLKAAAIMLLILLLRQFYFAIIVWILSIIPTFFRKNLLYKYVYSVDGQTITVKKTYDWDRFSVLEEVPFSEVKSLSTEACDNTYYETPTDRILTVEKQDGTTFSIAVDDYFYGLVDYFTRNEVKNDILG